MVKNSIKKLLAQVKEIYHQPQKGSLLISLATFLALIFIWFICCEWIKGNLLSAVKADVNYRVTAYGARMYSVLDQNIGILNGLQAFTEANHEYLNGDPYPDFLTYAAGLSTKQGSIRNFTIAPGGVTRYVYPPRGNDKILNVDIVHDPNYLFKTDVQWAIRHNTLIISGPYELPQGGYGLTIRQPVEVDNAFWGFVSMDIDLPSILSEGGLTSSTPGVTLGLINDSGQILFQNGPALNNNPVEIEIQLPYGKWILAAVPAMGWEQSIYYPLLTYKIGGLVIVLLLVLICYFGFEQQTMLNKAVRQRNRELQTVYAEKLKTQENLELSQAQLRDASRIAHLGRWEWNEKTQKFSWSQGISTILGISKTNLPEDYAGVLNVIYPDDREIFENKIKGIRPFTTDTDFEIRVWLSNSIRLLWVTINEMKDTSGNPVGLWGTIQDITDQHEARLDLIKSNRSFQMLSQCDKALVRAEGEDGMLDEICKLIIDVGGYHMVWIGIPKDDEEKTIVPVASAGFVDGYLSIAKFSYGDNEYAMGPAGMCIKSGKPVISSNVQHDPKMSSWRNEVVARNYKKCMAVPLLSHQIVIGAMVVYSEDPKSFDPDEIILMQSLADDIAFGLTAIRAKEKNEQTMEALRVSEEKFAKAFITSPDSININRMSDGMYININNGFTELTGYTKEDVIGKTSHEIDIWANPADREHLVEMLRDKGEVTEMEAPFRIKDGSITYASMSARILEIEGIPCILSVTRDISERRQAIEQITNLAKFPEESPNPVLRVDLDGRIIYANPTSVEIIQKKEFCEDNRLKEEYRILIERTISLGASQIFEKELNGRIYNICFAPLIKNGYLNLYFADVTDKNEMAKALKESETRYRTLVENFPNGTIFLFTPDKKVSAAGGKISEVMDLNARDLVGKYLPEVFNQEFADEVEPYLDKAIIGNSSSFEYSFMDNDLQIIAIPITDQDGVVIAAMMMTQDITQRKRAVKELTEQARYFINLNEITHAALQNTDYQVMLQTLSERISQLFKCQNCLIAEWDEPGKTIIPIAAAGMIQNSPFFTQPMEPSDPAFKLKDLKTIVIEDTAKPNDFLPTEIMAKFLSKSLICFPLQVNYQKIGAIFIGYTERQPLTALDIVHGEQVAGQVALAINRAQLFKQVQDDNIQLEKRVAERTADLESEFRELETFTYSVSHDLKAPLRGISGYSRLLLDEHSENLNPEAMRFLQTICRATDQMNQLIEDLLTYSRVERRTMATYPVNIYQLTASILTDLDPEIMLRKMKINNYLGNLIVKSDEKALHQVIRNLIDNAIKFTKGKDSPEIRIDGKDNGDSVILWVRDNGIGFDMKYHDRIFDIFQRLNAAEEYPGTGIGLAIVKKVMQRIGGKVWAESQPGEGATFYLEIPK